jgi:hypothetical protein
MTDTPANPFWKPIPPEVKAKYPDLCAWLEEQFEIVNDRADLCADLHDLSDDTREMWEGLAHKKWSGPRK